METYTCRNGMKVELKRGPSDGIVATLLAEGYSDKQVAAARAEIRKARDVISLVVRRGPE
jgi:hypothetical protein